MYKRNYAIIPRTIGGLIEDVFHNGWNQLHEEVSAFAAPVNIQETEKSFEVHLAAPGMKKEDFRLSVDRGVLQISVEQKEENNEQEGKWIRNEFRNRSFKRSFSLNEKVDIAKISAKYNDGILIVTLPKKEVSAPPTQEIPVE